MALGDALTSLGSVIGGAVGSDAASQGYADARRAYQDYLDYLRSIDVETDINAEAASAISQDPVVRNAQLQAMRQLQEVGSQGGMDTQSRVALRQAADVANANERAQREAIMAGAAQRGTVGGGQELAAKLAANQANANRVAATGAQSAADARTRALQAMMAGGAQANTMSGTDLGYQRAQTDINAFNAAQRMREAQFNAQQRLQRATSSLPGYSGIAGESERQGEAERRADTAMGTGIGGTIGSIAGSIPGIGQLFAEGGEVEEEEPSVAVKTFRALKKWFESEPGDEEASREVADSLNAALPEGLSARTPVKQHNRRLEEAYAAAEGRAEGGEVFGKKKDRELPEVELPVYRGETAKKERQKREREEGEEEKEKLLAVDEKADGGEVNLGRKKETELPEYDLPVYRGETARKEVAKKRAKQTEDEIHAALMVALEPEEKAKGGPVDYRRGGPIPGRPRYPGNDRRNDVVPIIASPGEDVIPNSIMSHPAAPILAARQVARVKALRKLQGRE